MRYRLVRLISALPFWWLYRLSDLLFLVVYRVFGYRKRVVLHNLQNSFPHFSDRELKATAKGFYRNLCDILVETLKGLSISKQELLNRVRVEGAEHLTKALENGHSVMALTSHLCNWEWMLLGLAAKTEAPTVGVYQTLKNPWGEELMKKIRARFGSEMVARERIVRQMVAWRKTPKLYGMVADQSPRKNENLTYFWQAFMHQETAFQRGPAVLAPKLQMAVMYLSMERTERGHYQIRIQPMRYPPFPSKEEDHSILSEYASLLEQDLDKQPSNWLWSHKRWKQQRPEGVMLHT